MKLTDIFIKGGFRLYSQQKLKLRIQYRYIIRYKN